MKKSLSGTVLYTAILLGVVGVAFYAGKSGWLQPPEKIPPPVAPKKTTVAQATASTPGKPAPQPIKTLEENKAKFADLLAGKWPERLQTDTQRRNYVRGFLRSGEFDPKEVPDLIAMLHDAPESADQQMMISELLARIAGNIPPSLGGADPALALKLLDNLSDPDQRRQMLATALTRMASTDPQAAWSELNKLPPGTVSAGIYTAIFSGFAKQDPVDAAAEAASLPAGPERNNALQGVAKTWLAADPSAALQWASGLPGNTSMVNDLIQSLANSNPKLAATYLDNMTDPIARNDTITIIGRKLSTGPTADPAAALAWFNQTATGSGYQTAVASLFSGLATPSVQTWVDANGTSGGSVSPYTQNTTLAVSLLAKVTDPAARQAAISSVADGWAKSDPKAALTWAQTLPDSDGSARTAALNTIVTTWSNTDPAAAGAFVQNSADPSVFLPIAPALAQTMAATNPQAALAFAQSLPAGTAQTQALNNAFTGLAQSNFTAAWTGAANLPPGDNQNTVLTNLVGVQAAKDPTQAAALLDKIPDVTAQLNATSSLAATWIKLDPQAFTIWLTALPTGDIRDTAIAQLASSAQAAKNPAGIQAWVNTVSNPQTKAALVEKLTQAPSQN